MSGVHRFVTRSTTPPSAPRKDDLGKEARLQALKHENGWINAHGRSPISGSPAVKASPGVSRRQLAAADARIKPAAYRHSLNESPAPSVAIKTLSGDNSTMPPPPVPISRAEADAEFYQDHEKSHDPFDTDVENADVTSTISDVGRVDLVEPVEPQREARVTDTQDYLTDQSEYEESLEGGPNDGRQSPEILYRHRFSANQTDEGLSDGDESTDQGSEIVEVRHGSIMESKEVLRPAERDAAYFNIHQTPNTRQKTIQSVIDSPTTQKSLAVRIVHQDAQRPIQSVAVDAPSHRSKQSTARINPELTSHPPLNAEQRISQKQPTRETSQMTDDHRINRRKLNNSGGHPTDDAVRTKRNTAQQGVITKQSPLLQHNANNQQFADSSKHRPELRPPDEDSMVPDRDHDVHRMPTNGEPENSHPQLGHQAANAEHMHLDYEHPIEEGNATHRAGMTAAIRDPTQPEDPMNLTSNTATKDTNPPQPTKADPRNKGPRKRPLELDYTREELSGMSYKLLNSESFDHIPKPTTTVLPSDLAQASLSEKLVYAYDLKGKEASAAQRRNVFASLPIEQYEEIGDLIIEKFTSLLNRYKEARREKREAARGFEKEMAQREERVRNKTNAVEQDLSGLKKGAEDVIRGKRS